MNDGEKTPSGDQPTDPDTPADCSLSEETIGAIPPPPRFSEWRIGDGQPLPAGRFRPTRYHDRGGLGEVFVARDEELDREVALKRMNLRQSGSRELARRFEQEAKLTGRLEHPGIVPIYGFGFDGEGNPV